MNDEALDKSTAAAPKTPLLSGRTAALLDRERRRKGGTGMTLDQLTEAQQGELQQLADRMEQAVESALLVPQVETVETAVGNIDKYLNRIRKAGLNLRAFLTRCLGRTRAKAEREHQIDHLERMLREVKYNRNRLEADLAATGRRADELEREIHGLCGAPVAAPEDPGVPEDPEFTRFDENDPDTFPTPATERDQYLVVIWDLVPMIPEFQYAAAVWDARRPGWVVIGGGWPGVVGYRRLGPACAVRFRDDKNERKTE